MTHFVGLDVSQKTTAVCVVDGDGGRLWRGQCLSTPEQIDEVVRKRAGADARVGIETGPMTTWLVHELRRCDLDVVSTHAMLDPHLKCS